MRRQALRMVNFQRCLILALLICCAMSFAGAAFAQTGGVSTNFKGSAAQAAYQVPVVASPTGSLAGMIEYWTSLHYSIIGPNKVERVSGRTIFFPKYPERTEYPSVNLTNKTLTVKHQSGQVGTFADVQPGAVVVICERDDVAVIIIMNSSSNAIKESLHVQ
jgi:hypothetical protein